MNVLVTGGSGFIGSHTVDVLIARGYNVIVVDKKGETEFFNPEATYLVGDITDHIFIERVFQTYCPRAVVHLAAQVDVQQSMKNPLNDIQANVLGTVNILKQCHQYNTKIIFASSAAVYGIPKQLPIKECDTTHPISIYGLSKLTAEHYIQLFHDMYGVRFCILRYANVYGPRQDYTGEGGVVSIFAHMLIKGCSPIIYGDGEQTRDFVFVTDVAKANVYALERGENEIFNVCTNKEVKINDLLNQMSDILNRTVHPIYQPKREGDISRSVLDNTKIKQKLRWEEEVRLREGLKETVCYFSMKYQHKILSM
ncbi:UDP-glucose 4-epimerase [Anoxybacillus tengchongensis]|uniref:UDP-glucose 4-epimerase n=1 Tax=Anoxybacillus tengchongensis TaxID=576944 RepID=A0A7X0D944_9BACL|nr:NAD-dependent epimerase/dehydratase family protein [Anoxybacillus tengchongensis]MBB6176075.1 UDP-glucose 4-epimerase [Anoxybacillus tengchongensis]